MWGCKSAHGNVWFTGSGYDIADIRAVTNVKRDRLRCVLRAIASVDSVVVLAWIKRVHVWYRLYNSGFDELGKKKHSVSGLDTCLYFALF